MATAKKLKLDNTSNDISTGFIFNVSDPKLSQKNIEYFNFIQQTAKDEYYEGVCFAITKYEQFKQAETTGNAIRITNVTKEINKCKLTYVNLLIVINAISYAKTHKPTRKVAANCNTR